MHVIQDRPPVSCIRECRRKRRLPHPLGRPCAVRSLAEQSLDLPSHLGELTHTICFGQRRKRGLVVPAAEHLNLAARDERPQSIDVGRLIGRKPVDQGAAEVHPGAHAGMTFEARDERLVRLREELLENEVVVPDRLVLMENEAEVNAIAHRPGRLMVRFIALRSG